MNSDGGVGLQLEEILKLTFKGNILLSSDDGEFYNSVVYISVHKKISIYNKMRGIYATF